MDLPYTGAARQAIDTVSPQDTRYSRVRDFDAVIARQVPDDPHRTKVVFASEMKNLFLDLLRAPVSRRRRKRQHLANAVARNIEMPSQFPLAHPLTARQPDLQIKFHGVNLLALPAAARREKWTTFTPPAPTIGRRYRGLVLLRRSQFALLGVHVWKQGPRLKRD